MVNDAVDYHYNITQRLLQKVLRATQLKEKPQPQPMSQAPLSMGRSDKAINDRQ